MRHTLPRHPRRKRKDTSMLDTQMTDPQGTDKAVTSPSTSRHQKFTPEVRKGLLGLGLGNTLEWYDWMVFGLLSAFIGPNFFPNTDPLSATLNTLAVFAVGFAFRPLGGVLLGTLADRIGRRRVMLLSIMLMAGTTLIIAVTPSYAADRRLGRRHPARLPHPAGHLHRHRGPALHLPRRRARARRPRRLRRRHHVLLRQHRHPAGLAGQLPLQPGPRRRRHGRLGLACPVHHRRRSSASSSSTCAAPCRKP